MIDIVLDSVLSDDDETDESYDNELSAQVTWCFDAIRVAR